LLPEVLMTILPDHVWCKILSLSGSERSLHPSSCQLALLAEQSRLLELRLVSKGFDKICTAENSLLIKACIRGNSRPILTCFTAGKPTQGGTALNLNNSGAFAAAPARLKPWMQCLAAS